MRNWQQELEYGDNYDNYPFYPEDYPAEVLNDIDFLEDSEVDEFVDEENFYEWYEEGSY